MDKKRKLVQFFSTLLYNLNLKGLIDGELYRGGSKGFCVPGLNCYSCPAAVGSCPLGALQSTLGNVKRGVSTYVFGILIAFGVALGRVICGWLCPFGLLQELLYKVPTPKCRSSLKRLRWIKYFILAVLVCLIPLYTAFVNGIGFPAFCKYICPQGTIGGILLMTAQEELRELAGMNFWWKFILLLCFLSVSIWVFRPFCRVICPLGVIYGLFNGIALVHMEVDKRKCTGCGKCSEACPMALKPVTQCNHAECIRCGKCVQSCNEEALHFRVKRGDNSRSNALQMMEKRIQSMRGKKRMNEEYKTESGQDTGAKSVKPLTETNQFAVNTGKKPSGKKKLGVLAVIVVVLAALAVGLGIYNKPENRLARQLDLGARYLEEQNYAEAVLAFEKAIQIDGRCMAAYVNGIEAYRHLDEPENLLAFYDKALEAVRSLEGEALTADMDAVVSIYLAAEDVYMDREALIALWEEGYEKSGQDGRVRDGLVRVYLERAEGRASDGAYEESLQDYDRLLELDGRNETVLAGLTGSLKSYLDFLLEEENFERVRELAEKYASALPDFDFEIYLDEIDRRESEKLRSQLELPFTADDVTLFGYKLTEDHFDDIVHLLDLKKDNGVTDGNGVPIDHWSQDGVNSLSSLVTASIYPDGRKSIDMDSKNGADNLYSVEPEGENAEYIQYVINTDKLTWLQHHFPGSYNLPLSCLGEKYENWYCAIPAKLIKDTGEYTCEVYENGAKTEMWAVEEPIRVSYVEYSYSDSVIGFDFPSRYCYLDYDSFRIAVDVDVNGLITHMLYFYTYEK